MPSLFDRSNAHAESAMVQRYKDWLQSHPLKADELSPRFFEDAEKILFYHSDHWGCNFSKDPVPLSILDPSWTGEACTSESIFQAAKFLRNNHEYALRIATASTAKEAASLGRDRSIPGIDPQWNDVSLGVMIEVLRAKIARHGKIAVALKETGSRILIENTAHANYDDYIWGCGKRGDGKNYLGIAWMIVRDSLRSS
jgi:ribA/ribD-fused uncharacterized protein